MPLGATWQIFQSPGVFNFFKPEYQALGAVINSNLFAPEFEISTAPLILGFLNGVTVSALKGSNQETLTQWTLTQWTLTRAE